MLTSNDFPLPCIRAALTVRRASIPQIARKHGASYHSCYAVLAGTRPGRSPQVRNAIREMFVIARRVLGPTHAAIRVVKNSLHSASLDEIAPTARANPVARVITTAAAPSDSHGSCCALCARRRRPARRA